MSNYIENATSCASPFEEDALSVAQAQQHILSCIEPLSDSQNRPLRDCLGQVLAEVVRAPNNVPGHTNSAMDGYALSGVDLPNEAIQRYKIIGKAMAGAAFQGQCGVGECVRIMTGAMMPEGTDTVVMQEQVDLQSDEFVSIGSGHRLGQNVRQAGEDIAQGELVFDVGRKITAADLGILASFGMAELAVIRRLRVAFFSTGNELRSVGDTLKPGEIYDSNRYTLYGMLKPSDVDIIDMGVIPDVPERIQAAFESAAKVADVVITSGGVSVGEADYIKPTLRKMGNVNFWKIAMKPGRPLTYGQLGEYPAGESRVEECQAGERQVDERQLGKRQAGERQSNKAHFFGLPGNPVAVMVTFIQFVKPALQRLSGQAASPALRFNARCSDAIRKRPGRMEFQRGIYSQSDEGEWHVELTGRQGSGILRSMSLANCFIVLLDEQASVAAGDWVLVEPFM